MRIPAGYHGHILDSAWLPPPKPAAGYRETRSRHVDLPWRAKHVPWRGPEKCL